MKENLFNLTSEQLKEIAVALQEKVNAGLKKDGETMEEAFIRTIYEYDEEHGEERV